MNNSMIRIAALILLGAGLVVSGPGRTAAAADWRIEELPLPPTWTRTVEVFDINDHGVVCGLGNYLSGSSGIAFTYDGTTITELPYLDPAPVDYPFGWARSINNHGVVAGLSHDANGVDRAVYWDSEGIHLIPWPADANTNYDMRAYAINDDGVIAGYYGSTTTTDPAAFYFDPDTGTVHSLVAALAAVGLNTGQSYADAINNNGLICGDARDAGNEYAFYTYDLATGTATNLGRLFMWDGSHVAGMNDLGQIVGRSRSDFTSPIHAILHDGTFHVIDDTVPVSQRSADLNNRGRIVGTSDDGADRWSWYSDGPGSGSMKTVAPAGWTRVSLTAINEHDVMIGYGRTATSGEYERSFVLTPPYGDRDHDTDIDLHDFATFAACFADGTVPSGCEEFDYEPDGDLDLTDFDHFAAALEGPGT